MKRSTLPVIAFLLAFGCQPNADESQKPVNPPKSSPGPAQAGLPTKANVVSPPDSKSAPQNSKPSETAKPGENSKRIYQLASLGKGKIKIDGKPIDVWLMDTDSKREEGMMWLEDKDVKQDEGMLFVFPKTGPLSFWMQNTVLPLDIMYISAAGKLLNVAAGKPFDETSLPSKGDAQFVLEMKQGAAKRLGFHAGSLVTIPAELKKAQ